MRDAAGGGRRQHGPPGRGAQAHQGWPALPRGPLGRRQLRQAGRQPGVWWAAVAARDRARLARPAGAPPPRPPPRQLRRRGQRRRPRQQRLPWHRHRRARRRVPRQPGAHRHLRALCRQPHHVPRARRCHAAGHGGRQVGAAARSGHPARGRVLGGVELRGAGARRRRRRWAGRLAAGRAAPALRDVGRGAALAVARDAALAGGDLLCADDGRGAPGAGSPRGRRHRLGLPAAPRAEHRHARGAAGHAAVRGGEPLWLQRRRRPRRAAGAGAAGPLLRGRRARGGGLGAARLRGARPADAAPQQPRRALHPVIRPGEGGG
mmetsp:Transcript_30497/g.76918  ORF Transcript_30497/g.76918 Transcript_30497/m.76918 type:complete len:320 (+) Transcript_30497:140-1099(+)